MDRQEGELIEMECLQDEHGKLIFKWTDLKIILSLINNDF
jgi:hypothetical protein